MDKINSEPMRQATNVLARESRSAAAPLDETKRAVPQELEKIRRQIDEIDSRLLDLMACRLGLAVSTLEVKHRNGLHATDVEREAEVVRRGARGARERGLEPEIVRDIFWRLIELSRAAGEPLQKGSR